MTAERLAEIARAITPYPGKELFAYIDAITARVAELEREVLNAETQKSELRMRAEAAEGRLAAALARLHAAEAQPWVYYD